MYYWSAPSTFLKNIEKRQDLEKSYKNDPSLGNPTSGLWRAYLTYFIKYFKKWHDHKIISILSTREIWKKKKKINTGHYRFNIESDYLFQIHLNNQYLEPEERLIYAQETANGIKHWNRCWTLMDSLTLKGVYYFP